MQQAAEALYDALARVVRSHDGRAALPPDVWSGPVESRWFELDTALEGLSARVHAIEAARELAEEAPLYSITPGTSSSEALAALGRRTTALREDLASIARGTPGAVTWLESGGRARKLSASPVDLTDVLRTRLFDVVPSVVLTSATLSTATHEAGTREAAAVPAQGAEPAAPDLDADESGRVEVDDTASLEPPRPAFTGPFRFQRQRLGLDPGLYHVDELRVVSPFRYEERALLYLPRDLPLPDEPAFGAAAAERCAALIAASDGGAFVLTTSLRSMHALHAALEERGLGRPLFVQGQAPKAALIERFRVEGNAVLVATLSFWQGVDVPGAALRLVVLEKAPFPVPNDPIVEARSHALRESGESPFTRLHLPIAQLTLKQGFGRLIRTESDYGVVALLDGRVHRRGYGRRLLEGLPPARRVTELAQVEAFWAERRRGVS